MISVVVVNCISLFIYCMSDIVSCGVAIVVLYVFVPFISWMWELCLVVLF